MPSALSRRIAADILREEFEMDGMPTSMLGDVFDREPVPLTQFITDPNYHKHPPLSKIQFDFVKQLEQIYLPETYIAMVEEFGEQWSPIPQRHMLVLEWGKGSKSPDSEVFDSETGQWVLLKDMKAGLVASAYAEEGKVEAHMGTDSFLEGHGEMFRVTTKGGRVTDVWEGHRFLSRTKVGRSYKYDWERLWDLQVGSRIAVTTRLPEPTQAVRLSGSEVELIGLFIGDGKNAHTKRVPSEMFSLPNDQIALLVSRLIDTDGWVSISNTVEVGYGTVSRGLAEDVRRLLLRLGVAAEVRQKNGTYKGESHVSWMVRVRDRRSVTTLLEQLTLLDKEPIRVAALEWCHARSENKARALHGDLAWDEIVSIEPLGWGEYWTLSVDGPASYISDGGILDHNSGKDSMCRLGVTRVADLLNALRSPQNYFGLPEQDDIHLLNVAASSDQARRAFFNPMRRLFTQNKHMMTMLRGDPPAEQAISIRLDKNIELISGHSLADTQEGLNLLVGIADEISAFKTKDELARAGVVAEGRDKKTAEGIVKMLRTSARTRFPHSFKVAQISYPRYKGDAIEQAMETGRKSIAFATSRGQESQYYISGPHPTWEVNPRVNDRSFFQEDYDEDSEMAAAMYECKPSGAVNRFIREDQAIRSAFSQVVPNPVEVEYYWGLPENEVESSQAPALVPSWQVRFHFHEDLNPMQGALYALHGDLALKGDRAGIAMSHVRTHVERDPIPGSSQIERRPVIRNDFTFSFESSLRTTVPGTDEPAPRTIQLRWYRQLIWDLIARGFSIMSVTFDGFQSADMIQILLSRGIQSKVVSLDRSDAVYQSLKDVILDNRIEGPYNPRLITELSSLQVLPNKKVDHPPSGSKDEADALAGSVLGAIEIGGDEGLIPESQSFTTSWLYMDGAAGSDMSSMLYGDSYESDLSFGRSELGSLSFGGR